MEKLAVSLNLEKLKGTNAKELALITRETALIKLASEQSLDLEKLMTMLQDHREDRASDERKIAVEAAVAEKTGEHAGGSV